MIAIYRLTAAGAVERAGTVTTESAARDALRGLGDAVAVAFDGGRFVASTWRTRVADWHAGSGTTGVAALLEGRRVILVERNPEHAETCRRRLAETLPGEGSRKAKQLGLFAGGTR